MLAPEGAHSSENVIGTGLLLATKVLEIITCTIFLVLICLLKISFSSYVLFNEHFKVSAKQFLQAPTPFKFPHFLKQKLLVFLNLCQLQLGFRSLYRSPRLTKAPYADAYWFLYSTKLTYVTQRTLPR